MWNRLVLTGAAAVAALVISAGCTSSDSGAQHPADQTSPASASASPRSQDHNKADVSFAQQMIPHHEQAVEMSDIVLAKQGIDPRVTDLATQIKNAQGPEIEQMRSWLTQWGNPPMAGHDMGDMSGGMMGMMSDEQIEALKNANGVDAGRLFLTDMIAHHEGAIAMAQNEIESGQFAPAVEMARSIVRTQQHEIDTMKGILATL